GSDAGGPGLAEPAWAGFRALKVTNVVPESATVSSILLTAADGTRLPTARAGQYLTLRVPGAGAPAPVRSYSLSSAPGARRAGRRQLRDQRQARTARCRERLPDHRAAAGRGPRGRRAPRRVRPGRRERPGPAHLRRDRPHAGTVHASPARGRSQRPRGVVD